jgi:hypothetical protein
MKKCHACGRDVQDGAVICRYCDARLDVATKSEATPDHFGPPALSSSAPDGPTSRQSPVGGPPAPSGRGGVVFRKLVWILALAAMLVAALDGFFSFRLQNSAPQQAAAAANACFQIIVPYVIARALDALTRD